MNRKKKVLHNNFFLKKHIDNLHFILNNILTKFFKELTKYKNDYQQYLNFIYRNYIISLSVSMHIQRVTSQYILIGKVERKYN